MLLLWELGWNRAWAHGPDSYSRPHTELGLHVIGLHDLVDCVTFSFPCIGTRNMHARLVESGHDTIRSRVGLEFPLMIRSENFDFNEDFGKSVDDVAAET